MPRKRRGESPTGVYHWIVRGMNKRKIFHDAEDIAQFFALVKEYQGETGLLIYHYCLMTNHVHMLVWAANLSNLSRFSHYVQRRYAYYYCKRYKWTGSVFQRGYKSFVIDRDEYLLECGRYIDRNPVRAKLVGKPEEYEFSSYRYYSEGRRDELLTFSPAYLGLSEDPKKRQGFYQEHVCENRIYEEMKDRGLLGE